MSGTVGVYPGTFDPITSGHMDIISRAAGIVDRLIIAIAVDTAKTTIFDLNKRVELVQAEIESLNSPKAVIEVMGFEGLVVNFARKQGAKILIRGLRAASDFEYEFQMSGMNSKIDPSIQTVFLPASENTHFVSSRLVKEIVRLGGEVKDMVSNNVLEHLKEYYGQ